DPNGFIAHIYNVSEAVSPAITLGFLGTDPRIGELCQYFKVCSTESQIYLLVVVCFCMIDNQTDSCQVVLKLVSSRGQ
ncbi:unnamed protein product, partial [Strongylus vulgaris]